MTLDEQRRLMRSGAVYNDLTDELVQARERTVLTTDRYNASFGQPAEVRVAILGQLFARVGSRVHFEPTLRCEFGFHVTVGDDVYANFDCVLLDGGGITLGNRVLLGPRVGIYTTNHVLDPRERAAGACYAKPVVLGDDVWVGGGVTINQGVTIGDGAVIGSGSVVTRSVPPNVVAAGVPARVLRPITDADRTGYLDA
ncbi:sugar O-acetyltransferase [Georgenia faecalis]|uniref:sugar O-acetyltransferase n=1 Tax=Georgenia faecalis TaxID=2483799 RepID=UPI000FD9E8B2|nr:sugar O-acetyltransferase [Georgenia faecalis]